MMLSTLESNTGRKAKHGYTSVETDTTLCHLPLENYTVLGGENKGHNSLITYKYTDEYYFEF